MKKSPQGKFLTEVQKAEKTPQGKQTFGWQGAVVKPQAPNTMNTPRRLAGHNAVAKAPDKNSVQKQYDQFKATRKGDK